MSIMQNNHQFIKHFLQNGEIYKIDSVIELFKNIRNNPGWDILSLK